MKKKGLIYSAAVLALILADQLSKLAVNARLSGGQHVIFHTHYTSGWFTLSIFPELHDRYPLYADVVIAVLGVAIAALLCVYLKYERPALLRGIPGAGEVKSSPKLTAAALCFFMAGVVCSTVLDAFLWGGSLDFIALDRAAVTTGAEGYTEITHFNFDLKDLYLLAGMLLLITRWAVFRMSLLKLPEASRKLILKRDFHFIRSMRELKSGDPEMLGLPEAASEPAEGEEKRKGHMGAVDFPFLVLFTVIFSLAFGYLIYFVAVYMLIPVAAELILPLESLLDGIGRKYDAELIYAKIRSFCTLLALFPGTYAANGGLRFREEDFIHDTGGTIVTSEALKYHMQRHLVCDIASTVTTVAICFVLWLLGQGSLSAHGFLYDAFGIPLGLLLSAIMSAVAQLSGVILAQNAWRGDYFYGE